MQGDVSSIVSVWLHTTPMLPHHPAFSSAQCFHWGCSHLGQWVMKESPINLSLGPPELKAWCERRATGERKLFRPDCRFHVHLPVLVARVKGQGWRGWGGNCGAPCSLFGKMKRRGHTVNCAMVDPDTLKQRDFKWAGVCLLESSKVLPDTNQSSEFFDRFLANAETKHHPFWRVCFVSKGQNNVLFVLF